MTVHPPLPQVEQGVLLGFSCPACGLFTRKYAGTCGCYCCVGCHHHVPTSAFRHAAQLVTFLVNHPSSQ